MTVGTALFSRLATENFARLQSGISGLQERISEGKNDPRPSDDPVRAMRLSAANDLRARIDRYATNAQSASDRLTVTDTVLADVSSMTRQVRELAMQSVNGTMSEEGAIGLRNEATRLRDALLSAANTRDAAGQPLFAGYGAGDAFAEGPEGITFRGDAGRTSLRLSESMTLTTSLNGADVFSTGPGGRDIFAVMDDLIATLSTEMRAASADITVDRSARISFPLDRSVVPMGLQLSGPQGTVSLNADMTAGVPGPMIDAINAASAATGVSATLDPDGSSIRLTAAGPISLTGAVRGDGARDMAAYVQPLDASGQNDGPRLGLRPARLEPEAFVGDLDDAVSNMAAQRAEAGALARVADRQIETMTARKLQTEISVAHLEELDMAAAVTKLQTLLMTQEAAQQSFVRIRSTGLFDYLR